MLPGQLGPLEPRKVPQLQKPLLGKKKKKLLKSYIFMNLKCSMSLTSKCSGFAKQF